MYAQAAEVYQGGLKLLLMVSCLSRTCYAFCRECAGPDDDSADRVLQAFGAQIALMVSPAQGNGEPASAKVLAWPLACGAILPVNH